MYVAAKRRLVVGVDTVTLSFSPVSTICQAPQLRYNGREKSAINDVEASVFLFLVLFFPFFSAPWYRSLFSLELALPSPDGQKAVRPIK